MLALLLVAGWLGWDARNDYQAMIEREYVALERSAHNRAAQIDGLIRSIDVMLFNIESDLEQTPDMPVATMNRMMKERIRQIAELRTMSVIDREGRVIASSLDALLGFDASKRPYFTQSREMDGGRGKTPLYISAPFKSNAGDWVILLTRVRHDAEDKFNGVTSATLDLKIFGEILASLDLASGEESLLIHKGGDILHALPSDAIKLGKNLASGIAYTEHMASGQDTTRHRNLTKLSGRDMMSVFHRVSETPLIVVATRPYDDVVAPWIRFMEARAGSYSLLAAFLVFLTWVAVRHQTVLVKQKELFRTVADFTYDWEYWLSPDRNFIYVSPSCERITGYTVEEFMAKPGLLNEIIEPDDQHVFAEHIHDIDKKDYSDLEFRIRTKHGEVRRIAHGCRPVYDSDGRYMGRRGSNRDITERKRMEQELEKHRHSLEAQIAVRTKELLIAKEAAEAANVAKSEFLANMSHELRTPLHQIHGMTHLIKRDPMTPKQTERLHTLDAACRRMTRIVDTILELTSLEAKSIDLIEETFDIEALVKAAIASIQESADAKQLALDLELNGIPANLKGSSIHIRIALLNYLSNAIRFTTTGRIITRVSLADEDAESALLRFEVEDTGIGIAPGDQERLFNIFEQVDNSSTRQHGGLGARLAMTRKIARIMGGDAGCTSAPGVGSTFWFSTRLRKA